MSLDQSPKGPTRKICSSSFDSLCETKIRLLQLGFLPDEDVTVVHRGSFSNNILVEVRGSKFALTADEAHLIKLKN
ncbi:MAG: ferrous iron transport protein A [Halobacteriovoraceae bacterium]|nr:ferrous iron transport protein A [Halobacteriovoraceae bacterium]